VVKIEWLDPKNTFPLDDVRKVESWIVKREADLQDLCMIEKRLQEIFENEIFIGMVIPETRCFWCIEVGESNGVFDIALIYEDNLVAQVLLENLSCYTKQDTLRLKSKILDFMKRERRACFREIVEGVDEN